MNIPNYADWLKTLLPAQREDAEERAAIIEEGSKVSTTHAELAAMKLLRARWEGQASE